jgi:formate hydrogenlyase subunit 6/NADH:ubiquinone oxidoreductase subunit I/coenzyme F420-reducing hydrogenase delta subunit
MISSKKLIEAFKAVANPPFTVKYPFVPSPPPPTFRGKPEYDEEKCVGCGICVERCPSKAIEIEDLGAERKLTIHYDFCIHCAFCNYKCMPVEGIKPTQKYSLILTDRSQAIYSIKKPTVVVSVNEDLCIGCARCEYTCKFKAAKVTKKTDKWISTIDSVKCKGCGMCNSVCPAIAIDVPLSPNENVIEEIGKLSEVSRDYKPNILILHCNWARFAPKELAEAVDNANLKFINITCSGRLHATFILEAFKNGYDGVMVFTCPKEECHFEGGPKHAKPLIDMLKLLLEESGLEPERLEIVLGSNIEPDKYYKALTEMVKKLNEIGYSKLRSLMEVDS